MRFRVTRTTLYGDEAPCEGLTAGMVERWDRRTFKTEAEFDAKFGDTRWGRWRDSGTEHGMWSRNGESGIQRRLEDEPAWFVDLADLDALVAFIEKHGELVLDNEPLSIEIYDGWRE